MDPTFDLNLALTIKQLLTKDPRLSAHALDVTVINGIVTMRGTVQSYRRKQAALQIAEAVPGCRGVSDHIEVEPAGSESDEEIAEAVRAILSAHADVPKNAITVSVEAARVTLQGNVSSAWERRLAEDLTLGARGVRAVSSLVVIDPRAQQESESLTEDIRLAFAGTAALQGSRIRVAVDGNGVVLSGEVPALWQRKLAEEVVSRFQVTELRNEIQVSD